MRKYEARLHRKARIRKKVSGTPNRPRLSVYKSLKHLHVQVVDDASGRTLASASTIAKDVQARIGKGSKSDAAKQIGLVIAERCKAANIKAVVFDRNGFPYHGRIAAIADGAREGGLTC